MNDRTLVKVDCGKELLDIRTISAARKSPQRFAVLRDELRSLEERKYLITTDMGSFAVLRLSDGPDKTQMLEIKFTWVREACDSMVSGWTEEVRLPYARFHQFMEAGEEMDGVKWCQLSIPETVTRRLEFRSSRVLHEVAQRPVLRHKLGKLLSQHFQWKRCEKIVIYDESLPFSFFFEEYTARGLGICGVIILHGTENLQTAQYSVHT